VSVPETRRNWLAWAFAVVFAVAFVAAAFLYFRAAPAAPAETRVMYGLFPPEDTSVDWNAVLSPDGRSVAYWGIGAGLWVQRLDSPTPQFLPGTEGAWFPFWSPDSRSLGFFTDAKLKRIEVTGGPAVTLADAPNGFGGSWSPQGVIVFAPSYEGALQQVAAAGGTTKPAITLGGDYSQSLPWFLPDGRHFLFLGQKLSEPTELRIGALDSSEVKTVGRADSSAFSSGYLLFVRENTLVAQPFDPSLLTTRGEAVPIAQHVPSLARLGRQFGQFSVSRERSLAYKTGTGADLLQLTWFDRNGRQIGTLGDAGSFSTLEFSPDHTSLAVSRTAQGSDIWIYEVARGLPARFTSNLGSPQLAAWSPDGRSIAYTLRRDGKVGLYRQALDGSGKEELLYEDDVLRFPYSWSRDGFLLLWQTDSKTGIDIGVLPLEQGATHAPLKPYPWLANSFNEVPGRFSPDGRWVAYFSNESGRYEIYVAPFPGPGPKRQISSSGGSRPRWRADGKEIFYVGPDGLMAAEVSVKAATIEVGAVRPLGIRVSLGTGFLYDVSADGQRILAAVQKSHAPLTLVENWTELLKKK
jgi:Tol biopolymer transport system component